MKTGDLFAEFVWHRAAHGYKWQETRYGKMLVTAQNDGQPLRLVTYQPFAKTYSALFKQLLALPATHDDVLGFANDYGLLGSPLTLQIVPGIGLQHVAPKETTNANPHRHSAPWTTGEFLTLKKWDQRLFGSTWADQLRELRLALDRDRPSRMPAHTQGVINDNLQRSVHPYMWWLEEERRFELRFRPVSLIGAIWAQAALSLTGPKKYRRCPMCSTPIEISRSGGARADALFCSDACRSRNRRDRIEKARLMKKRGMSDAAIAKKLGTKTTVVTGWVTD